MHEILNNDITFCDPEDVKETFFMIYFTAKWCGPCQKVKPLYNALSEGFDKDVCQFCLCDIDENEELTDSFKIQAVPTFVLMKGNTYVGETAGADIRKVHELLKTHLPTSSPANNSQ